VRIYGSIKTEENIMNSISRVVILESEGIIALDLKAFLKNRSDSVKVVRSFSALFNIISSEKTDLVILDSAEDTLPEKVSILKNIFKVPVILLTDFPDTYLKELKIKGCVYLKKPFRKKEFIKALNESPNVTSSRMLKIREAAL
jgi:DNA-binding response OmpR family regulator